MNKKKYTHDQIKKLSKNKNIARCGSTKVRYSKEFKQAAIKQYNKGLSAIEIFQNAGIDLTIIGKYAPNKLMNQWRTALRVNLDKDSSPLDKLHNNLEMLRSQVAYLKAENHFLAQLRAKKKR
jgi:transposase-like protein